MTIMALLKYFTAEKCGLPFPISSGSLNMQQLSSTAIEEPNKKVSAVLYDPAKCLVPHGQYLFSTGIIA